jgi:hypothetical protein
MFTKQRKLTFSAGCLCSAAQPAGNEPDRCLILLTSYTVAVEQRFRLLLTSQTYRISAFPTKQGAARKLEVRCVNHTVQPALTPQQGRARAVMSDVKYMRECHLLCWLALLYASAFQTGWNDAAVLELACFLVGVV